MQDLLPPTEDDEDTSARVDGEFEEDYARAVDVALREHKVSASYIMRRLGIGYNRAALCVERMEKHGIVGKDTGSGRRSVLKSIAGT